MSKKKLNKLVRDRIPYELIKNEQKFQAKVLDKDSYRNELVKKILEESQEVSGAWKEYLDAQGGINTYCVEEEIGDLLEAIFCLMKELKIPSKAIREIMDKKRQKKGSFKDKIFLEWLEVNLD